MGLPKSDASSECFFYETYHPKLRHFLEELTKHSEDSFLRNKIQSFLASPQTHRDWTQTFGIQNKKNLIGQQLPNNLGAGLRFVPSAGSNANDMSYRIQTPDSSDHLKQLVRSLASKIGITPKNSLLLSAYPADLNFPEEFNSLNSPGRPEIIESFIQKHADAFESVVLICQPIFLTYLTKWSQQLPRIASKLILVTGGSSATESYRSFIKKKLSLPENGVWVDLYGLAEVAVGFGLRTNGSDPFNYNPESYYLEAPEGRLLVTLMSSKNFPTIIRYDTGDRGELVSPGKVKLLGRFSEPLSAGQIVMTRIYENHDIAAKLTGRWFVREKTFWLESWSQENFSEIESAWIKTIALKSNLDLKLKSLTKDPFVSHAWDNLDLLRKGSYYDQS